MTDDEFPDDLPEQVRVRREKYDRLAADPATTPYPVGVPRTHELARIREQYADLPLDAHTGDEVGVTGRVIFVRNTGKLCFATLREGDTELQAMISLAEVGPESLAAWKADVDLGDHVFVRGEVISSRRGELSVLAREWRMAAKALRPLPVSHRPLSEQTRVRQRYLDLVMRPEARATVRTRAAVTRSVRETLHGRGYLELETPILQSVHGGAAARPFRTHLNAFDLDMSLRIATELYLKRAIVGGLEKVYELGRVFRNEGVDSSHSPEFTTLEFYEAYADYDAVARVLTDIIRNAADAVGARAPVNAAGVEIDLFSEWRSTTLFGAVSEALGEAVDMDTPPDRLRALAAGARVETKPEANSGQIVMELFEQLVEHTLIAPTFVRDYPASVVPLARPHRDDPRLVEAWDLIIDGVEVGVGYSELADPVEQRRRLVEQSRAKAAGDAEAMELDEDFLLALEYGMPPTGGVGMGIDRLVMLLTGRGIRETILFPLLKPM